MIKLTNEEGLPNRLLLGIRKVEQAIEIILTESSSQGWPQCLKLCTSFVVRLNGLLYVSLFFKSSTQPPCCSSLAPVAEIPYQSEVAIHASRLLQENPVDCLN